jgi:hypothetical protein
MTSRSRIKVETLEEYVIVSQDRYEATLFRRANHWQPEVCSRLDDSLALKAIDLAIPLSAIYEGVAIGAVG